MTTISDIRDRLRIDLHDPAGDRWDDDAIDRHILHALRDIDAAIPREASSDIPTTAGSRDISLSGLAGLVAVEAIEYPVDHYPRSDVPFSAWDGGLTLHIPSLPAGGDARVYYTATHELDEMGTSLPAHLEDVLATGAAAYAALEQATATIDTLNTGGSGVSAEFADRGRAWMSAFRELLHHHSRRNRLRSRRLYMPA